MRGGRKKASSKRFYLQKPAWMQLERTFRGFIKLGVLNGSVRGHLCGTVHAQPSAPRLPSRCAFVRDTCYIFSLSITFALASAAWTNLPQVIKKEKRKKEKSAGVLSDVQNARARRPRRLWWTQLAPHRRITRRGPRRSERLCAAIL